MISPDTLRDEVKQDQFYDPCVILGQRVKKLTNKDG